MASASNRPVGTSPRSLSGLLPFLRPYGFQIALALFFILMAAAAMLILPMALRRLIDGGLLGGNKVTDISAQLSILQQHFAVLLALILAMGFFSAGRFYALSWLSERVTTDVRIAVYSQIMQQSPEFFESTKAGEVLSCLNADSGMIRSTVNSTLSMGLRDLFLLIGAMTMLVWTNTWLMLEVLVILAIIVVPIVYIGRLVRKLSRASQDRTSATNAIASETIHAVPVVQSYTAENREILRFINASQNAFDATMTRDKTRAALTAFLIAASSTGLLCGLYLGSQAVLHGDMTFGQLGQNSVYIIILARAFSALGETYGDLLRAAGATERLMELLDSKFSIQSPSNPAVASTINTGSAIKFEAIEFNYPSRPQQIALSNFNLDVKPGETVALVGPSGAGKSTVFQLLLRFYDPKSGSITLDGVATNALSLQDLRGRIGIVPQDAVIFSANALENIRYGTPDATDAEVKDAAKAAFADAFLTQLPEGYDTFLGERGVRLSGGQRQRIAIARAILKNPPLLLLDEATSALDAESERMVQAALEHAMAGRTTLVIAHRLATVQKADRIIVLDHGKIIEQGTHTELMAKGGMYARLAELQFRVQTDS
ncbi:MAG TPA: ABC transporter transmembrane domain-containing protein [Burkholderiaceae bacterium]|nr:ABC transporter transmembrane domain-containing protein [Burkholderiaceae bacterium]